MRCFSQPVESVSGTTIFARGVAGGGQPLVYGMTLGVHSTAAFDHALYCQSDTAIEARLATWERSTGPAATFVRGDSSGIVDGGAYCHRSLIVGEAPNRDTIVRPVDASEARPA